MVMNESRESPLEVHLRETLSKLPMRSIAFWSSVLLVPCFEMILREPWWHFSRRRRASWCRKVLLDLIDGKKWRMTTRLAEASRISAALDLAPGMRGLSGSAIYSILTSLSIWYDCFV